MKNLEHDITLTIPRDRPLNFEFLTAHELTSFVPFSASTLLKMARQKKIPYKKYGYRTIRFDLERVKAALNKFEILERR